MFWLILVPNWTIIRFLKTPLAQCSRVEGVLTWRSYMDGSPNGRLFSAGCALWLALFCCQTASLPVGCRWAETMLEADSSGSLRTSSRLSVVGWAVAPLSVFHRGTHRQNAPAKHFICLIRKWKSKPTINRNFCFIDEALQ